MKVPDKEIYIFHRHKDGTQDLTIRDNIALKKMMDSPKCGDSISNYTTTIFRSKASNKDLKKYYGENTEIYDLTRVG